MAGVLHFQGGTNLARRAGDTAVRAQRGPSRPLPCQDSHISNEGLDGIEPGDRIRDFMAWEGSKREYALHQNVQLLVDDVGINRIGFFTLTFKGGCRDIVEAQRRFNSFSTGFLREFFGPWVCVVERHKGGGVHFHLVVDVGEDIRTNKAGTGVLDFDAVARADYRTANDALRRRWSALRKAQKAYGFGERACELLPIRVSGKAVGRYVGKYLGKHMGCRRKADKRKKLIRYGKGANRVRQQISWATPGAQTWRAKVGLVAVLCGGYEGNDWQAKIRSFLGPRWAFQLRPVLLALRGAAEFPGRRVEFPDAAVNQLLEVLNFAHHRFKRRSKPKEPGEGAEWVTMSVQPSVFTRLELSPRTTISSRRCRSVGTCAELVCASRPWEWFQVKVVSCVEAPDGWTITVERNNRTTFSETET